MDLKGELKGNKDTNAQKSYSGQVSSGRTVGGERSRRRRLMMPDHGTQLEALTCITKDSG